MVLNLKLNSILVIDGVSKDILTEYDFEITKSGLKQVEANKYLLNNKIILLGHGCQEGTHKFEISLDPETKKLKIIGVVNATYHGFHPAFGDDKYIDIKLLDPHGNIKKVKIL